MKFGTSSEATSKNISISEEEAIEDLVLNISHAEKHEAHRWMKSNKATGLKEGLLYLFTMKFGISSEAISIKYPMKSSQIHKFWK